MRVRDKAIKAGVKSLNEFGYPQCNRENILTDEIYKAFFLSLLEDHLEQDEINKMFPELK